MAISDKKYHLQQGGGNQAACGVKYPLTLSPVAFTTTKTHRRCRRCLAIIAAESARPATKRELVTVILNGRPRQFDAGNARGIIYYKSLCAFADIDPALVPTVTFHLPNGIDDILQPHQCAPLQQGAIYNVMITSNG